MNLRLIAIVIPLIESNIESEQKIWTQTRSSSDDLNGLLEFPGGKVEAGENPKEAAARELFEETGIRVEGAALELFKIYLHHYETKSVNIFAFIHRTTKDVYPAEGWIDLRSDWRPELEARIPPANYEIFDDLVREFR